MKNSWKAYFIFSEKELTYNEEGDVTTSSEYTDIDSYSLEDLKEFGWLNDEFEKNKVLSDNFYRKIVYPSIGGMPLDVKNEIEELIENEHPTLF